MILKLISQSTVEPVTLTEMRTYLRMESTDSTSEDSMIQDFITDARKAAENLTNRALVPSTWQLFLDEFENTTIAIVLPNPPISTASSSIVITYVEDTTAGTSTTLSSTGYTVDSDSEPGRVYPSYGNEWPDGYRDQAKAITIQFASGYTTTNPCPSAIKNWIKMRVAQNYEFREPTITGVIPAKIDRSFVNGLLDPYILPTVST